MQIPTTGRAVHYIAQNEAGELFHRHATVSSIVGRVNGDSDYVLNLHVFLEPGDRFGADGTSHIGADPADKKHDPKAAAQAVPLVLVRNVLPDQIPPDGIPAAEPRAFNTWHWPERA